jgi:hypothetical protein
MIRNAARLLLLAGALAPAVHAQSSGPQFSAGGVLGYSTGLGVHANVMAADFAQGFPLAARLGFSWAATQPGHALDARRIFINNATNGTPEESGRNLGVRVDMLYPVRVLSLPRSYAFGGMRHSSFRGNFKFIGGNEDFDVTSSQWGLGGGLDNYFAVSGRVDMVITAGVDYFFSSTLTGHDTAYSPDGDNVNPREDFTYADADGAIHQPKFTPLLLMGFNYRF